jgi:hypothetical protein
MAMKKSSYEKSSADKSKDKREAGKRGMSMKKWEGSPADNRMDRAAMKKMGKKK